MQEEMSEDVETASFKEIDRAPQADLNDFENLLAFLAFSLKFLINSEIQINTCYAYLVLQLIVILNSVHEWNFNAPVGIFSAVFLLFKRSVSNGIKLVNQITNWYLGCVVLMPGVHFLADVEYE